MTLAQRRAEALAKVEAAVNGLKLAAGAESVGRVRMDHYENAARSLAAASVLLDPTQWNEVES